MYNAVNWFEIPSRDFDRAVAFYSAVLGKPLRKEIFNGTPNGIFPYEGDGIGGAVIHAEHSQPSMSAAIVYLNTGTEAGLDAALSRVVDAGGTVLLPKIPIGEPGFIALIGDTEGNRVGLHAPHSA